MPKNLALSQTNWVSSGTSAFSGTIRGTDEWNSGHKVRGSVEKSINHFKDSFCVSGRKTQNEKPLHADLLLAGIAQLITVMVATNYINTNISVV